LPGQVLAAEILTRPVVLRRLEGEVEVLIDRRGVTDAVYTTEGKAALCRETFRGNRFESAARLDDEIHEFVLGTGESSFLEIPTREFPLRWASGGVLPVVNWRGREWSPFFLRDIAPAGWNLSAGSSETEEELMQPVSFGLREFVEETIVLPRKPQAGIELRAKTFPDIMRNSGGDIGAALDTVNRHLDLRSLEDGLTLPKFRDGEVPPDRAIATTFDGTRTRLRVRGDDGENEISDVLACFNLMELGIEIISIVRFDLDADDYLLDGEMITPFGERVELVRMPVAMLSHSYLREVFGDGDSGLVYGRPPLALYDGAMDVWKQSRPSQPSIRASRPPDEGEIVVFGWDVVRRYELSGAGSLEDDRWKSDPMRIRHRQWTKTFSRYFEPNVSAGAPREAYPFFTCVTAKALTYYFALNEGVKPS
jgi:hypothetical protein